MKDKKNFKQVIIIIGVLFLIPFTSCQLIEPEPDYYSVAGSWSYTVEETQDSREVLVFNFEGDNNFTSFTETCSGPSLSNCEQTHGADATWTRRDEEIKVTFLSISGNKYYTIIELTEDKLTLETNGDILSFKKIN